MMTKPATEAAVQDTIIPAALQDLQDEHMETSS
jgi:hypothetical protein